MREREKESKREREVSILGRSLVACCITTKDKMDRNEKRNHQNQNLFFYKTKTLLVYIVFRIVHVIRKGFKPIRLPIAHLVA